MALKLRKKSGNVQKVIKKTKVVVKKSKKSATKDTSTLTIPTGQYTEAVGRRKVATARVRIYESAGDFIINDEVAGKYFSTVPYAPKQYNLPFELTGTKGKFAVTAKVSGSGISAQLDAVVHGISRALVKYNPDLKPLLKEHGLMTRDDRMKETRKIGMGGKARRQRQSPRR